jgi:hypothetical protein
LPHNGLAVLCESSSLPSCWPSCVAASVTTKLRMTPHRGEHGQRAVPAVDAELVLVAEHWHRDFSGNAPLGLVCA